jgi:phosphoglucomutase
MSRKYFGTDGVRGRVGEHPMTVEFALRLASAAARVLAPEGGTALVGKDTIDLVDPVTGKVYAQSPVSVEGDIDAAYTAAAAAFAAADGLSLG